MNDLIDDINKLQKITVNISKNIPWNLNVVSALHDLREIISEKQSIVNKFEKQASNDIQELCSSLRKEYDDFCGIQNLAEEEALRRHQEENKNE